MTLPSGTFRMSVRWSLYILNDVIESIDFKCSSTRNKVTSVRHSESD
jgi:hypothetical protein